jgi:cobalt-zinc-cadmium efflux system membrane fusion protein
MRQIKAFGAGLGLGAALLFAAASFGLVGKAAAPAPPRAEGHGEAEGDGGKGGHGGAHVIELAPDAKALAGIEVAPAGRRRLSKTLSLPGEVTIPSGGISHVGPRIEGVIHIALAEIGTSVKEGELLAVLDSIPMGEAKAAYLKALAEHELAEKTLVREQKLSTEGGSARKDLLEAEAGLAKAAIELKMARDRLQLLGLSDADIARVLEEKGEDRAHVPIVAPLAGVVTDRHATPGEFVRPEEKLFTIADLDAVWVMASVPEKDVHDVREGVEAAIRVTAQPHETFTGKVTHIAPQVDPKTRMVRVRLETPNTRHLLKPEMFAEVELPIAEQAEALAVPAAAVQRVEGKPAIFVTKDGRRFERRMIQLGIESDGLVEVRSGLEPGESVVVKGAFLLKSELEKEAIGGPD